MLYFLYFLVGGTIMVLALLLSQSKYLFLPGLMLINMGMQMKNRKEDTFHIVLQNTVFGAVGMLLFTMLAFSWFKPGISVMSALAIYAIWQIYFVDVCLTGKRSYRMDSSFYLEKNCHFIS